MRAERRLQAAKPEAHAVNAGTQSVFVRGRKQARFHEWPGSRCHVAQREDGQGAFLRFSGFFLAMRQRVANFARQWVGVPKLIRQFAGQPVSVMSARFHVPNKT
jgi:hypothetical protein